MSKIVKMEYVSNYTTGLRRGYIRVSDRRESDYKPVPGTVDGLRGNARWAMQAAQSAGATHYTTENGQQYNSTQYCYTVYRFYRGV